MRTPMRVAAIVAVLVAPAAVRSQEAIEQLRIDREVGAVRAMALEGGQNRLLVLSEQIGRISVADPEVADLKVVTPTQVLLTAKTVGTTDLTLWNRNNVPLVIALNVTRNLEGLRRQLKELFPQEKVSVSAAGDLVVLSGQVSDVRLPERIAEVARLHATKVANLVQVSGVQQVQLEVRFAEVSRTGLRELGVNFFHKAESGRQVGGVFGPRTFPGDFLNSGGNPSIPGTGPSGLAAPGFPPDVPNPAFNNAFAVFLSGMGSFPFSAMLSLLEQNNLAKTLAEPTLVAMSGQAASFHAGGEIPIPLSSTFGSVSVDWKKFGIKLDFTPTVISDAIHMRLRAEVSDLDPTTAVTLGGTTIPGLTTRSSETTVRLGDGQSFAVAGLLSDRVRSQVARMPFLGSIPILGVLFRSQAYQREETELLVVVTSRLARPMSPHEVPALPTDHEVNDPGDLSWYLTGSEGSAVDVPPAQRPEERGPSGQRGYTR